MTHLVSPENPENRQAVRQTVPDKPGGVNHGPGAEVAHERGVVSRADKGCARERQQQQQQVQPDPVPWR